jgi:23S rRNA A1618 N6-methylase RlmF
MHMFLLTNTILKRLILVTLSCKALNNALLVTYYDIQNWDIQRTIFALPFLEEQTTFMYIADL